MILEQRANTNGNVGIVAATANENASLSLLLWTRRNSDPPNTFGAPQTIFPGTQPYTCLNERGLAFIGNSAGVQTALDPADGTKLWTSEQWSNNAARCVRNTRIVQYQIMGGGRIFSKRSKP